MLSAEKYELKLTLLFTIFVTVDTFFADTTVMLEHYYLEDKQARVLYPHKAQVNMLTWDIDRETGMVWCNFTR